MKGISLIFTYLISIIIGILSQNKDIIMDTQEKDKVLACAEIINKKFQKDQVN